MGTKSPCCNAIVDGALTDGTITGYCSICGKKVVYLDQSRNEHWISNGKEWIMNDKEPILLMIIEDQCWSHHNLYYAKEKNTDTIILYCPICKMMGECDNERPFIQELKETYWSWLFNDNEIEDEFDEFYHTTK